MSTMPRASEFLPHEASLSDLVVFPDLINYPDVQVDMSLSHHILEINDQMFDDMSIQLLDCGWWPVGPTVDNCAKEYVNFWRLNQYL